MFYLLWQKLQPPLKNSLALFFFFSISVSSNTMPCTGDLYNTSWTTSTSTTTTSNNTLVSVSIHTDLVHSHQQPPQLSASPPMLRWHQRWLLYNTSIHGDGTNLVHHPTTTTINVSNRLVHRGHHHHNCPRYNPSIYSDCTNLVHHHQWQRQHLRWHQCWPLVQSRYAQRLCTNPVHHPNDSNNTYSGISIYTVTVQTLSTTTNDSDNTHIGISIYTVTVQTQSTTTNDSDNSRWH